MPKLTKRFVDLIEPPNEEGSKDFFFWDSELPGFGLRVKTSGIKSYVIQYRQTGRSRRMTLGRHGVLTAEEARKLARRQLGHVAHGKDPAKARQDDRRAPSVRDLADDYMARHAVPNKRPASIRNDRSMLDNIVLPKLGSLKVAEVNVSYQGALIMTHRDGFPRFSATRDAARKPRPTRHGEAASGRAGEPAVSAGGGVGKP